MRMEFSTDGVPERNRLEHWRDIFAKTIINVDWCPLLDRPFQQKAKVRGLPGLGIVIGTESSTGFVVRRTPELISGGSDNLVLTLQLAGDFFQSQLGRETNIGPGEAVLASSSDVGVAALKPNSRFIALSLPRRELAQLVPQIENQIGSLIPRELEALGLLKTYLFALIENDEIRSPALQELVVRHIYDLVAWALDPRQEAFARAQSGGLPAARLQAIKSDIVANLGDSELSESVIASRHRVSSRYVRLLFESEGTTFSDFLRRTRLTRAHQMLTDRRYRDRTVSSVAYEAGFGDLSHFNRLFRRLYGMRPSELRARKIPFF
jgi:AraC-like DNA-binding protein